MADKSIVNEAVEMLIERGRRAGPPSARDDDAPKDEEPSERNPYYAAERRYMTALQAYHCAPGDIPDEVWEEMEKARDAMMFKEAPGSWAIYRKLSIIEEVLTDQFQNGFSYYPQALVYLAALRADLLAIETRRDKRSEEEAYANMGRVVRFGAPESCEKCGWKKGVGYDYGS